MAATAGGDGVGLVRGLGADEVLEKSYGILRRGGTLVSVSGTVDQARADALGLTVLRRGA